MERTKVLGWRDIRQATASLAFLFVILIVATPQVEGQTFTVLHTFTGGPDGANPEAGLTLDHGNLYGTTAGGGLSAGGHSFGTVFRMQFRGSGWIFAPLYNFSGGDGDSPHGRVTFGPDGSLYGTTADGRGNGCSCGNVFNLKPPPTRPANPLTPWLETVLYQFDYFAGDGNNPAGDIVFDATGNLFGTTYTGGNDQMCGGLGCGTVYELTRSGQSWTANFIYAFTEVAYNPLSGVTRDPAGNLYFTASQGNIAHGAVLELTPAGSGWTANTLYSFNGSGPGYPVAGLILDSQGNLYGAASVGGSGGGGTVFQLTPSGGGWNLETLYSLSGNQMGRAGPNASLLMDSAGNLYGTTAADGAYGKGSVFKLTPGEGGWTYTTLYDFTGGADGGDPAGALVMDGSGNLYGTTYAGGTVGSHCESSGSQCGVVFEITP
ncbi:MAG: choice-of-anchor tandem repeat GloVer-containing protein [Candidatus Korobacteraceae bacterium]